MFDKVINRRELQEMFPEILRRSRLCRKRIEEFLISGNMSESDVIIQSTSGCVPLLIPRSHNDILNAAHRMFAPYRTAFGVNPERVALLGGVSHTNAAANLPTAGITLRNFRVDAVNELNSFDPDFLSCYPSVLRDLIANPQLRLKRLRAINIGGEPVLRSDIVKVRRELGVVLVYEQYGSTEMPTMALKVFTRRDDVTIETPAGTLSQFPYALETERFTFALPDTDGWHPVILQDEFPGQLAPFGCAYDTGDEGFFRAQQLFAVRRVGDKLGRFLPDVDRLLMEGCTNVQFSLESATLRYSGHVTLGDTVQVDGYRFRAERVPPQRQFPSNKMPILVEDSFWKDRPRDRSMAL